MSEEPLNSPDKNLKNVIILIDKKIIDLNERQLLLIRSKLLNELKHFQITLLIYILIYLIFDKPHSYYIIALSLTITFFQITYTIYQIIKTYSKNFLFKILFDEKNDLFIFGVMKNDTIISIELKRDDFYFGDGRPKSFYNISQSKLFLEIFEFGKKQALISQPVITGVWDAKEMIELEKKLSDLGVEKKVTL